MSAIAQATTRLRIVAGAVIAPLRHPLLLAKDLATLDLLAEARLVVQPTVSWHRDECAALGAPCAERGCILDEQLDVLRAAWSPGPVGHHGRSFDFDDVWVEPGPWRPGGPALWFGGTGVHPPLLRPAGAVRQRAPPVRPADRPRPRPSPARHGSRRPRPACPGGRRRHPRDLPGPADLADLAAALSSVPRQLARGCTVLCFKPAMFLDGPALVGPFCRELVREVEKLSAEPT